MVLKRKRCVASYHDMTMFMASALIISNSIMTGETRRADRGRAARLHDLWAHRLARMEEGKLREHTLFTDSCCSRLKAECLFMQGPGGPKTLCNACGLRYAKKKRQEDEPPEGSGPGHAAASEA
jgi:hypothetical protein